MKGAILSDFVVKIIAIITFILVSGTFFLLFSFEKDNVRTYNIKSVSSDIDTRLMLNNILVTPVNISGEVMEFQEMVEMVKYRQITKAQADAEARRLAGIAEHVYSNGDTEGCRSVYLLSALDRGAEIMESHLSKSILSQVKDKASSVACINGWEGDNPNLITVERDIVLQSGDVVTVRLIKVTFKEGR